MMTAFLLVFYSVLHYFWLMDKRLKQHESRDESFPIFKQKYIVLDTQTACINFHMCFLNQVKIWLFSAYSNAGDMALTAACYCDLHRYLWCLSYCWQRSLWSWRTSVYYRRKYLKAYFGHCIILSLVTGFLSTLSFTTSRQRSLTLVMCPRCRTLSCSIVYLLSITQLEPVRIVRRIDIRIRLNTGSVKNPNTNSKWVAHLKCHATGAQLNNAINVRRRDKTPAEVVNTPCCNRHRCACRIKGRWTDMSQCVWSMAQHPFQGQESRQVLQFCSCWGRHFSFIK